VSIQPWKIGPLRAEEAADVLEAVRRAGGKARLAEAVADDHWRVGILELPDVAAFTRALATVGLQACIAYSAGSGWHFDTGARLNEGEGS
jgi:hypothetical protein